MCRRCISFSLRSPRGERSVAPFYSGNLPPERTDDPDTCAEELACKQQRSPACRLKIPLFSRVTFPGKRETMIVGACLETLLPGSGFSAAT